MPNKKQVEHFRCKTSFRKIDAILYSKKKLMSGSDIIRKQRTEMDQAKYKVNVLGIFSSQDTILENNHNRKISGTLRMPPISQLLLLPPTRSIHISIICSKSAIQFTVSTN